MDGTFEEENIDLLICPPGMIMCQKVLLARIDGTENGINLLGIDVYAIDGTRIELGMIPEVFPEQNDKYHFGAQYLVDGLHQVLKGRLAQHDWDWRFTGTGRDPCERPYVQIDFCEDVVIFRIVIWNRSDCNLDLINGTALSCIDSRGSCQLFIPLSGAQLVYDFSAPFPPVLSKNSANYPIEKSEDCTVGQFELLKNIERRSRRIFITKKLNCAIPNSIGNLTKTTTLALNKCGLIGSIPEQFGRCFCMQWLQLEHNQLVGSIPEQLFNCTLLEALELKNNRLTGPISPLIGRLSHLTILSVSNNLLSGPIPTAVGNLNMIAIIELENNQLSGPIPSELFVSSFLWKLNLSNNLFSGSIPSSIGNCAALIEVDLSKNNLCGSLPIEIGYLPKLLLLNLSFNHDLAGMIPEKLFCLRGLNLDVEGTDLQHGSCISLEMPQFSFIVLPRENLLSMTRLLSHEEAGIIFSGGKGKPVENISNGILLKLQPHWLSALSAWRSSDGRNVVRRQIVFISHRWLSHSHPDDSENSKLNHIQDLAREHPEWKYFWIDFLCVPQNDFAAQTKAINSLPHYVKCCSSMVTLCGNRGASKLKVYKSRGWCRLEQMSSIVPLEGLEFGRPFECLTKCYIANKDDKTCFEMERFNQDELNPQKGFFYDDNDSEKPDSEKDKYRVQTCIQSLCDHIARSKASTEDLKLLAAEVIATILFPSNLNG